ncbi:hypothetical protein J5837_14240 [Pseudoxanthomonas helianthi]|uniref:Uncharacterized protein n=1 Tax=Pseudoxanthomonas helianthi TaxID=1453541 RepID=A0A940X491_9GAMM|nr:hypothetical protein [Pseudoxanthomonas helianthi]MBP3985569.1 hypothetical protein [Pseudoxanthomonas helianthi]
MEEQLRNQQVFADLEDRLARLEPKDVANLKRDRWPFGIMLVGMAMSMLTTIGLTGEVVAWLTVVGVVLEFCGAGVFFYRQARDAVPDFIDSKRKFSLDLDSKLLAHEETLAWLRTLPLQERNRRITYLDYRLEVLAQRYQILFGAVDKLGLLPMLVATFVQSLAINSVSFPTALCALGLLALYGMAIWLARFRLQMQRYARLLREAGANDKHESMLADAEAV